MAPEPTEAAIGDENPQAGEAGAKQEETGLVRMRLDDSVLESYTGPTTADVHPDEVENWKAGGWVIDQAQPSEDEHANNTDSPAAAADDPSTASVVEGVAPLGASSNGTDGQ